MEVHNLTNIIHELGFVPVFTPRFRGRERMGCFIFSFLFVNPSGTWIPWGSLLYSSPQLCLV